MTALAGYWRFDGKPDARVCCARMLSAQSIYGPHDTAQWSEGVFGCGRNLFRTLPEDIHDRGPLIGAEGRYVLVADVRLDNRDELIDTLAISTEQALVSSDSVILLAAFEHWGENLVDHISGDYAFVLFDWQQRHLVLARDFLGQRPLHYHRSKKCFAFASMPKGLHALPEIPRAPDEERIAEFLTLMPESGSRSFFAGVERVEAGHIVTVTATGLCARRYWQPTRSPTILKNASAYADALRHHLDRAVRVRLRGAKGEVGAHLSAGFDSSAIAATAARLLAPAGGRVVAFTAVPRDGYGGQVPKGRIGNEGPLAAATAALHSNIEHVQIRTDGTSPFDALDRNFYLFERPMLNLCNGVWMNAINKAARDRKLTIVLSGQMGNMSISYSGIEILPELLLARRWGKLLSTARQIVRSGAMRWRGAAAASFGPFVPPSFWAWINNTVGGRSYDVREYTAAAPTLLDELNLAKRARSRDLDFSYRPWRDGFSMRVWVLRRVDLGNYNKGVLAGWGIDQRDPTADKELIEFCLSVPTEQFVAGGMPRALARLALADRLPHAVLNERRKGLQAIDWHEGLTTARHVAADEVNCLYDCGPASRVLNLQRMQSLIDHWPSDGWERKPVQLAYRLALLRGISTGHFLRKASGSN